MGVGLSGGRHARVVEPSRRAPLLPPSLLLLHSHPLCTHWDNSHGLIVLAVCVPGRRGGRGRSVVGGGRGRSVVGGAGMQLDGEGVGGVFSSGWGRTCV